jgi:hypothetical protein
MLRFRWTILYAAYIIPNSLQLMSANSSTYPVLPLLPRKNILHLALLLLWFYLTLAIFTRK